MYIYIYIYIYVCVCVYLCVCTYLHIFDLFLDIFAFKFCPHGNNSCYMYDNTQYLLKILVYTCMIIKNISRTITI